MVQVLFLPVDLVFEPDFEADLEPDFDLVFEPDFVLRFVALLLDFEPRLLALLPGLESRLTALLPERLPDLELRLAVVVALLLLDFDFELCLAVAVALLRFFEELELVLDFCLLPRLLVELLLAVDLCRGLEPAASYLRPPLFPFLAPVVEVLLFEQVPLSRKTIHCYSCSCT